MFQHHQSTSYASDITLDQCNQPSGSMEEGKKYLSGKNCFYGYKVEVYISKTGQAMNCTRHEPGGTCDMDMLMSNINSHAIAFCKRREESKRSDDGFHSVRHPEQWAVLCDKGYKGCTSIIRAINPKNKTSPEFVTNMDERFNHEVSCDRIISEDYFGRIENL